jgi:hypothetical protein
MNVLRNWKSSILLVGMKNNIAFVENSLAGLQKVKHEIIL